MSFSQLVFDDTAATPVDKPFHAFFPMDVARVLVVICDEVVKNLILHLKSTSSNTIWQVSQILKYLPFISSACPWKNAEYSAYHQHNDSQQASMLTSRKQTLLHSAQQPCLDPCPPAFPRLLHKRALLYNSRDQESRDRHRYPTTRVRWMLSTAV